MTTKIFNDGYLISPIDKKALEDSLLDIESWIKGAINGMVNQAKKTILNSYLPILLNDPEIEEIPNNEMDQLMLIFNRDYFTPFNVDTFLESNVIRLEENSINILENGIDILAHEELALANFFKDYEGYLISLLENKIFLSRERMIVEWTKRVREHTELQTLPASQDEYISLICSLPEYQNRAQRESQ